MTKKNKQMTEEERERQRAYNRAYYHRKRKKNAQEERTPRTREQLWELSRQYRDRAARKGVEFRIEYNERYELYTVSVVGECGYTVVPLRLLPTTLNGLFMAGRRVRGIYLSMKRSKKFDFPR